MALATINQSCKIVGSSMELYLFPYAGPFTGTGSTSLTAALTAMYALLYTTPATKTGLIGTQWALLDSSGVSFKYKADVVDADTNALGKVPAGYGPPEITIDGQLIDVNADHIFDIFSATANEEVPTAASSSVYGSKAVAIGSARRVQYLSGIIRWLSPTVTGGPVTAWDHIVLPCLTITPEVDLKLNRKDNTVAKFTFRVLPDLTILSPDSNGAVAGFIDTATAAATHA